jgi:hypothetical protein
MAVYELGPGQPVIVVGPQRSGKSNLIAFLVDDVASVVIIDSSQHPDEWGLWGPAHGYVVTSDPDDILRYPKVVFQIDMTVLLDVQGWKKPDNVWTRALANIMRRGNSHVVFDEMVYQLPGGHPNPAAMQIYTMGAKFGLTPVAGSQYANRIETMTVRAAVHAFAFKFNPYDRRLLAEKRGAPTEALAELPPYGFGYHLTNTPGWIIHAPAPLVMSAAERASERPTDPVAERPTPSS